MPKIEYTFELNEDEKIVFKVNEYNTTYLYYLSFATAFFEQREVSTTLTYDTLYGMTVDLNVSLENILKGNNVLDEQKISDLGFEYNEICHTLCLNEYERRINTINKYMVWSPVLKKGNIKTWMYSNGSGEIIICMTPVYPFEFSSKRVKNYASYDEWIKRYKCFSKRIIAQQTVRKWMQQTEDIMALIARNSALHKEASIR